MNSRQRRQDRREWKHIINLGSRSFDDYIEMWNWLAEKHGKKILRCGWRCKVEVNADTADEYFLTWQFIREKDAAEFTLKWS